MTATSHSTTATGTLTVHVAGSTITVPAPEDPTEPTIHIELNGRPIAGVLADGTLGNWPDGTTWQRLTNS